MAFENLPTLADIICRVPNNSPVDNYYNHHSWQGLAVQDSTLLASTDVICSPLNQAASYARVLAPSSSDFAKTTLPDQIRPDMPCYPSLENKDRLACLAKGLDPRGTSSKSCNALKRCRKSEQGHGSHKRAKRQCLPLKEGEHKLKEDWEATEQEGANSDATPVALEWGNLIHQLDEIALQGQGQEGH